MHCAIVGAGMAGLACADRLASAGHVVTVFDKGRRPGGRLSTRRLDTVLGSIAFDYGAQYFTARHPDFCRLVQAWHDRGVVAPWPLVAADAWVGSPGMSSVIEHLAAPHDVTWDNTILSVMRDDGRWRLVGNTGQSAAYDAVVLAIPAEQAAPILSLHDFAMARIALMARSRPCWTAMFGFDAPIADWPNIIRSNGDVTWAARNSAKPGRSGPEAWVAQANADWTEARIGWAPDAVATALHAALAVAGGSAIPPPIAAVAHRWRYALSAGTGDGALWQPDLALGVCGDWLLGPRVECAWLSGNLLAETMIGAGQAAN